jgi:hypothetical protein
MHNTGVSGCHHHNDPVPSTGSTIGGGCDIVDHTSSPPRLHSVSSVLVPLQRNTTTTSRKPIPPTYVSPLVLRVEMKNARIQHYHPPSLLSSSSSSSRVPLEISIRRIESTRMVLPDIDLEQDPYQEYGNEDDHDHRSNSSSSSSRSHHSPLPHLAQLDSSYMDDDDDNDDDEGGVHSEVSLEGPSTGSPLLPVPLLSEDRSMHMISFQPSRSTGTSGSNSTGSSHQLRNHNVMTHDAEDSVPTCDDDRRLSHRSRNSHHHSVSTTTTTHDSVWDMTITTLDDESDDIITKSFAVVV